MQFRILNALKYIIAIKRKKICTHANTNKLGGKENKGGGYFTATTVIDYHFVKIMPSDARNSFAVMLWHSCLLIFA